MTIHLPKETFTYETGLFLKLPFGYALRYSLAQTDKKGYYKFRLYLCRRSCKVIYWIF